MHILCQSLHNSSRICIKGITCLNAIDSANCEQHEIKVTFAAPHHQEMNGICERAWQSICNIAFAPLVHARMGYAYLFFVSGACLEDPRMPTHQESFEE